MELTVPDCHATNNTFLIDFEPFFENFEKNLEVQQIFRLDELMKCDKNSKNKNLQESTWRVDLKMYTAYNIETYEIKQVLIKNFNKFLKEKYFNPGNNQVQQPIPGKVDPSDSIETTDSETNDDTDRFSYFSNKLKIFVQDLKQTLKYYHYFWIILLYLVLGVLVLKFLWDICQSIFKRKKREEGGEEGKEAEANANTNATQAIEKENEINNKNENETLLQTQTETIILNSYTNKNNNTNISKQDEYGIDVDIDNTSLILTEKDIDDLERGSNTLQLDVEKLQKRQRFGSKRDEGEERERLAESMDYNKNQHIINYNSPGNERTPMTDVRDRKIISEIGSVSERESNFNNNNNKVRGVRNYSNRNSYMNAIDGPMSFAGQEKLIRGWGNLYRKLSKGK